MIATKIGVAAFLLLGFLGSLSGLGFFLVAMATAVVLTALGIALAWKAHWRSLLVTAAASGFALWFLGFSAFTLTIGPAMMAAAFAWWKLAGVQLVLAKPAPSVHPAE